MWSARSPWAAPATVGLTPDHAALARRLAGHLLLAALPLLAISGHVFDLVPMHLTAGLLVVPLLVVIVIASAWRPLEQDRMLLRAAIVGAVATAVYDTIRLDTVYMLGWWGDFIPSIGAWILNTDDPTTGLVTDPGLAEVLVGYVWRYAGDGAGIGIWFYVLAAALGLRDRGPGITITAAVAFAVAPVWAGLIATVGLAPRAAELMFPLNERTLALSLLGHLIFGLVLGIGAARADRLDRLWPWPPPPIPGLDAALDWLQGGAQSPRPPSSGPERRRVPTGHPRAGWSAAVGSASPALAARPGETTNLVPPRIEPCTGRAEVTELVAPVRAALPPATPRPTPTPAPAPAASLPRAPKGSRTARGEDRDDTEIVSYRSGPPRPPRPPGPRAPISGPVPIPATAAPPSHGPRRGERPTGRGPGAMRGAGPETHDPVVVWGRLPNPNEPADESAENCIDDAEVVDEPTAVRGPRW